MRNYIYLMISILLNGKTRVVFYILEMIVATGCYYISVRYPELIFENTRIITTWIYLTATYFQFLAHFNKGQKEYKKYLKTIKKERIKAVREEFQRIVVVGRP